MKSDSAKATADDRKKESDKKEKLKKG